MMSFNFDCPASELQAGDIIEAITHHPFGTAQVQQVKDGRIYLFRPYGHQSDFTTSAGIICYVGIEEWDIPADGRVFHVYQRTNPR